MDKVSVVGSYYRIHAANEALETMLDAGRQDGWTAEGDIAVKGLAVCDSIESLYRYIETYGMCVEPGDRLVRVEGRYAGPDHDQHACRIVASEYELLGDAREWLDACAAIQEACDDWDVDEEAV